MRQGEGVAADKIANFVRSHGSSPPNHRSKLGFARGLVSLCKANLPAVPEHRASAEIDFADVRKVSGRPREFTRSALDMYGVGHNSEHGL